MTKAYPHTPEEIAQCVADRLLGWPHMSGGDHSLAEWKSHWWPPRDGALRKKRIAQAQEAYKKARRRNSPDYFTTNVAEGWREVCSYQWVMSQKEAGEQHE